MKKWITYVFFMGFASYWASNLVLWYPWSYSATLGITLMLTVTPVIWAYATYRSFATFPGEKSWRSVAAIASIYLLVAVVLDFVFFGIMRGAMEQLLHPTTFYGYGFLVFWPILFFFLFPKKASQQIIGKAELLYSSFTGISCAASIALIIIYDIKL